MNHAQQTILTALSTIPPSAWQRQDGLRCERGVINLGKREFAWALFRLRQRGLIERKKADWPHYRLPWFRLAQHSTNPETKP